VVNLTLALPAWKRICGKYKLKCRLIPRDVATRWNSTYDLLRFSLQYCTAIDDITNNKAFKLQKYELEPKDWLIIKDLVAVLKQYKNATIYFSGDSASISAVILAMDRIDAHLNFHAQHPLHPAIVVAMKLA
jgi:hypothetical protein